MDINSNILVSSWFLNREITTPYYKQLALYIKDKINNGDIPDGYMFPTFRKMVQLFDTSRHTLSTCFDLLVAEGYVTQNSSKRYFVTLQSATSNNLKIDWHYYINRSKHNVEKNLIFFGDEQSPSQEKHTNINNRDFNFKDIYIPAIRKAAENISDSICYHENGHPELLEQLVKHLARRNIRAKPSQILVVQNEHMATYLLSIGFLSAGTTIIAPKFNRFLSAISSEVTSTNIKHVKSDGNGIIIEDLFSKITNNYRPVLFPEPFTNLALGISSPSERKREILDLCTRKQVPIIEIDYPSEIVMSHDNPIKSLDTQNNVIYHSSLGSSFSYSNSLSFIVASEYVIRYLTKIHANIIVKCPGLIQETYAELLKSGAYYDYIDELTPKIHKRLIDTDVLLKHYLSQYATWIIPEGGFFIAIIFIEQINILKLSLSSEICTWIFYPPSNMLFLTVTSCTLPELEEFIAHLAKECEKQSSASLFTTD